MALNAIILCELKNFLIQFYDSWKGMVYSNYENYSESKNGGMQNLYNLQKLDDFFEAGKGSGWGVKLIYLHTKIL